ncbi:MAG: hypothetical protein HDR82_11445 [Bacteroides sp.]|nr:hypothetical protein [Bacteroides sp.]
MKFLKNNILILASLLVMLGLQGCAEADPNFKHDDCFISQLIARGSRAGTDFVGTIYEYDKNGNLLEPGFTPEEAAGGSGVITFVIGPSDAKVIDLTACYLRATLTYDEFVTPSMSGIHDILVTEEKPDGKVFTVVSGEKSVRKYRVMGVYE